MNKKSETLCMNDEKKGFNDLNGNQTLISFSMTKEDEKKK